MKHFKLNAIAGLMIKTFLFLIIILPSGTVGNLNVKMLSMLLLIISVSLSIINKGVVNKNSIKLFFVFILSMSFVLINYASSSNIAIYRGYATTEGLLFTSYFLSTIVLLISILEGIISKKEIIKTIFYSCILYSIIKIALITLSAIGVISIYFISDFIYQSYGIKPMLFPITDTITRFQLANDYIVCFALYFILYRGEILDFLNKKLRTAFTIILICGVLISFSRYMILLLVIGAIVKIVGIRKISPKGVLASAAILAISLSVYISNADSINDTIYLRFASDANVASDATRSIQVECLSRAFNSSPLFGHGGLGDFSSTCPGPNGAEFSYEVQYLGFLYRFGIIQTIMIALVYFLQYKLSSPDRLLRKYNIPAVVAFLCWMTIGFFNPYLISGYASVITVLCVCFTGEKRKNDL
ncbi:TPA: hypothetical protein JHK08_000860 [Escherichia coli]|nr:hypothetical protein [Escherichia coli]